MLRVWRALKIPRSTGHPRSGQAIGPAFLLVLFFGGAKKSTSAPRQARESTSPFTAKHAAEKENLTIRQGENLTLKIQTSKKTGAAAPVLKPHEQ
jgi:hypothetical protein